MTATDLLGICRKYAPTGLAVAIGLVIVAAITTSSRPPSVPKVVIGTRDVVYYSQHSTRQDALALGQALRQNRFFTDRGASVVLAKAHGGTELSFILLQGTWDRPNVISDFGEMGRVIAPAIGGFPLRLRLVDEKFTLHKTLMVGKETVGDRDTIYYYGSATPAEATQLGQLLRTAGAMRNEGSTVVLAKGDVTTISFVVRQAPWERPDILAAYESLMREVAPSLGGLPLRLRFLDSVGTVHKEVSIL